MQVSASRRLKVDAEGSFVNHPITVAHSLDFSFLNRSAAFQLDAENSVGLRHAPQAQSAESGYSQPGPQTTQEPDRHWMIAVDGWMAVDLGGSKDPLGFTGGSLCKIGKCPVLEQYLGGRPAVERQPAAASLELQNESSGLKAMALHNEVVRQNRNDVIKRPRDSPIVAMVPE
jgi:hypothetical protein